MIRKDIKTRIMASGAEVSIPVFHFIGKDLGAPSLYIQSCIHGAEVQGYLVALRLIEYFSNNQPNGSVTIVPIANPYGLNCKIGEYTHGRFDPVTGDNWNRNYLDMSYLVNNFIVKDLAFKKIINSFKELLNKEIVKKLAEPLSYHKKLALQLQEMAVAADIVLDLHCDTISMPHVYSAEYAIRSVKELRIPYVIEIPNSFGGALDEATFCPWIKLIAKYNAENNADMAIPVEAFTIELGNEEYVDNKNSLSQTQGILNYLSYKGICDAKDDENDFSICISRLEDFVRIYAPVGGLIMESAELGKVIKKGEELLSLSVPNVLKESKDSRFVLSDTMKKITSEFEVIPITKTTSSVVNEGMTMMKLIRNFKFN